MIRLLNSRKIVSDIVFDMADLTLAVDDQDLAAAKLVAEGAGTTVHQMIRDYLSGLIHSTTADDLAEEFVRISREANSHSHGWNYNREDAFEGR